MKSFRSELSLIWLSLLVTIVVLLGAVESRKDKIKLKDVQVLTLKPDVWTAGRRSTPVPQLKCVGGYCEAIKGQTVQCYNRGSDGRDVQWECKTQMDSNYKFGSVEVTCEGYDYADDDYVLVGSCGLEYSIDGHTRSQTWGSDAVYNHLKNKPSNGFSIGFIMTIGVIIFIIYYACLRPQRTAPGDHMPRASGAPPPPGFRDSFDDSDRCGASSSGSAGFSGFTYERPHTTRANANTGNGFFTGLFTGGALGYLFGSRNTTNYRDQNSYFNRQSSPYSSRGFGSGSSGFGSGSGSTTTTSSGFGGTKRR
ncbi:unnamed protein product [Medioppia subpectinata]|uniref:Store-operated calcium entry-associated regulatory factor n=1 Tax=Medioppia subpectinata TaxID=1979941 RepID=A0A7R9PYN6_9ACAR|nr:unnamed protein product [Medioppia subpectinata]CAG2105592.1 unnamed protein product [Medioppia subpectinata]